MTSVRLRHFVTVNPATHSFHRIPEDVEVDFLPMESVWPSRWRDGLQKRIKSDVSTGYTRFQDRDVLVPKITPTFEAGRSILVDQLVNGVGTGTTELHVLRPGPHIDGRFLCYVTQSHDFLRIGESQMFGVAGQQRVPDDFVRDFPIRVLEQCDQRRIADFLDAETAHIDRLLTDQAQMLTLIDERRIAVTSALVFGREHPGKRRDSTLPTVGDIPADWDVVRNKTILREVADLSATGDEELLTVSHLTGVTPRSEKDVYMFLAETMVGYKVCHPGDLVINTLWAWMGALGVSSDFGIVSPAYGVYRLTSESVNGAYLDALLRTPEYVAEMTRFSKGVWTSRLRLYPESFLALRIPLPPLDEQLRIVEAIRDATEREGRLRAKIEKFSRKLTERRQALITAAVTGAIDVTTARGFDPSGGV